MRICDGIVVAYNSSFVISYSLLFMVMLPTRLVLTLFPWWTSMDPLLSLRDGDHMNQKLCSCSMW